MPSAHPGRVHRGTFHQARNKVFPLWVAVNTRGRFKPHYAARWRWRRGALFLYWKMFTLEYKRRAGHDPAAYYYDMRPLDIKDLKHSQILTKRQDPRYIEGVIIPPGNAAVSEVLDMRGRLTKDGLRGLEDKEFVWPYLDVKCPQQPMFSELEVGKQWERMWMDHYYGHDAAPPPLEVGGHVEPSFALVYARYLRELGRAGSGTKLGRWLDIWLERAETEEKRLEQLRS